VTIGPLLLFSAGSGDAWMLAPADRLALSSTAVGLSDLPENHAQATPALSARSSHLAGTFGRRSNLKVLGTRHGFNGIADSPDHFLSLREMKEVVALDRAARTVTVQSGMSYGQLCPSLDRDGFALHNLASLPHISIAGACATGTHGSGVNNGNLSTAVSAFEIVTAGGDVLSIARSKDPRTFQATVVNLGALGVVTKVTLNVEPAFTMRQDVYLDVPMAQVREHFEDIVAAGYSVSLFSDWQKGRVNEVWVKRRVEKRRQRAAHARTTRERKIAAHF
jgi:alditol oxidase